MSIRESLKHAFSVSREEEKLTEEEENLLKKLAEEIAKRKLGIIAITFLESVKYMNYIGSQVMLFFKPIVETIFPTRIYADIQKILEKRPSIEYLIKRIEEKC